MLLCNLRKCRKKQALNRLLSSNFIIQNNLKNKHELSKTIEGDSDARRHRTGGILTQSLCRRGSLGSPTAVYLPDISEYGLGWDYTQLMSAEGKLRVVSAEDDIASISAGTPVRVKVYSLNGILLGSFECTRSEVKARMQQEHLGRGTFVVRMQSADRSETVKISL